MPEIMFSIFRYILPVLAVVILLGCTMALLGNRPKLYTMAKLISAINGDEIPLKYWETSLGRSKACDVMLSYGAVSRFHAVISRRKSGWVITDTFSKTGVYINGEKIEKKALINDGDSLSLGPVVMFFRINDVNAVTLPLANPKSDTQELPDLTGIIEAKATHQTEITEYEDVSSGYEDISSGRDMYETNDTNTYEGYPALAMAATNEVFYILDNDCIIGRLVECDVQLNYQTVALNHAKISKNDEGFIIENFDMVSGTIVNGRQIAGKQMLFDKDTIVIGGIGLTFYSSYSQRKAGGE